MKISEQPLTLSQAQQALSPFLQANPFSLLEIDDTEEKKLGIKTPWGDSSLFLIIQEDEINSIANTLNNIYLPERFTAIWHHDTKDFEIIFTAYKLHDELVDIQDRKFNIRYKGKEYNCHFFRSSERLLELARIAAPIGETSTEYRNLRSFKHYIKHHLHQNIEDGELQIGEPISFWIRNIDWDEDKIIELIQHLNFYNAYYDRKFPRILIHSPKTKAITNLISERYREPSFPQNITMHNIDIHLLHYWEASNQGDSSRRFTYSYRILSCSPFIGQETGIN